MTRSPLVSLWVMAAVLGAGSTAAEETSPLLNKGSQSVSAPAPVAPRTISPTAVKQLNAVTPKFDAAAAAKPAEPAASLAPDLRETDKPKNTIIRLPEYVVQEQAPVILKPRDIDTPKSRLERALKRNPGLRFGSFWIFRNDGIALAMLEEEQRLERMREAYDLVTLLPAAEQKQVKRVVDQTFIRP